MKKLSTIIMALALVLGMSQCKKQETPTTGNTTPTNPGVHITVNVGDQDGKDGKDNNGEKHNIAPDYGLFAFTQGDVLYVGHNGKFVGTLTFANGFFDGFIYPDGSVTGQPLHFYFVGNAEVTGTPVENETTSLSISIANQSANLPVLSYGPSTKPFTGANATYSTTLKNKCALVKLSLKNPTTETVTLSDVPTVATVNFANFTAETAIAANTTDLHDITLRYDANWNNNLRWVILLPGTNLSNCGVTWQGEGNMPAMENNTYVNANLQLNNPAPVPDAPDAQYAVKNSDGELIQFSVSANKKVYFSCGNLRYGESLSSKPGWSLHPRQFDEHEDAYGRHGYSGTNMTGTGYNATYDLDRICWGRLANDGNYTYTAGGSWIYADNLDLTRTNGTDWGTVLTTEGNNWRMLTADEWNYLFNATARGSKRFIKVNVRDWDGVGTAYGVHVGTNFGVLLLPDNYAGTGLSNTTLSAFNNGNGKKFLTIDLNSAGTDDVSKMLNAGAVFLPALGYRNADQYVTEQYQEYTYYNVMSVDNFYQSFGYYWSSTRVDNGGAHEEDRMAKVLTFNKEINAYSEMLRRRGACVRLVWDAN